ncbi:hypothetical protein E3N88_02253 [Mikania micrantha]|uniref:Uncharacterized protein n=1 Tax=Mikania micrantha TaxID=192012 RepID=A0A5N6Q5Q2_9ASTR|nr:hypothetical protein E3N88_02253 [Mikania micrantha]
MSLSFAEPALSFDTKPFAINLHSLLRSHDCHSWAQTHSAMPLSPEPHSQATLSRRYTRLNISLGQFVEAEPPYTQLVIIILIDTNLSCIKLVNRVLCLETPCVKKPKAERCPTEFLVKLTGPPHDLGPRPVAGV